jgi:CDP-6-deoxy-D-xylo-4-hexulose-3-dehydrase
MLRESSDNLIQEQFKSQYPDLNPLFIFTHPGFNVRNNEIGALIGISQLRRLDDMVEKRANNFNHFLSLMPDWVFTDFNLQGQSNYAFNVILNDPDPVLMNRLESTFNNEGIEFRRGSAGGGNQLRQPYVRNLPKFSKIDPSLAAPVADHIHFYGMYLGNYPELAKSDIDYICKVINSI